MSTEAWVSRLEDESIALKQSFERAATTVPVWSKERSYNTVANTITIAGAFTYNVPERFYVTFNTNDGSNTIATLEFDRNSSSDIRVRRVPYSGGARWMIITMPNSTGGNWLTTNFTLSVHSMVDGEISVQSINS